MSASAIFVSHSHKDDAYCHAFVAALRAAGLDIWYDEHNATAGHLRELIERELRLRPIFVVVLTPAALASEWVTDECDWAYNLYRRDRAHRVILPVLAETVNEEDIWLFMQQFKRIEQAGLQPWPAEEAARRVALALDPNAPTATTAPPSTPAAAPPSLDRSDELDALLARANALVSQGRRRDAIGVLRQATTVAPRSVAAWSALGYHLDYVTQSQNDASEALEAFERALLLEPNNAFAFAWAGRANALALYHPQQALVYAEKAIALDPKSAFAQCGKGAALSELGRHQDALDALDRTLILDPGYAQAWANKGATLNNLGRYQEALDACERALALEPGLGNAWSNTGYGLNELGRDQDALDAYDRALALDPGHAIAWHGKGASLYKLGRYQEALSAYDRALAIEPDLAPAWHNKGVSLYYLDRYQEALEAFDHALALKQDAATWEWKALALRMLGRVKEAEEAEGKAKELEGKQ